MLIGTLTTIWRYPTKSLRWESLDAVEVESDGVRGDRTAAYFVRSPEHARAGKTYRGKENDRLHLVDGDGTAAALAAQRGVDVERRAGERYFDDAPVSLLVDRWLDELSAALGYAVEPIRFRPNFFVSAAPEFAAGEAALEGHEIRIGELRLRVRCPIERCVTTTYHPDGEESDARILRFVAQLRNTWMGIYCDVVLPATVRVGETVTSL